MQSIKKVLLGYVLAVTAMLGITSAHAAVPVGVQTLFTDLATDFGTIAGYGWVLFLVVVGGLALFGIVRRVFKKAT